MPSLRRIADIATANPPEVHDWDVPIPLVDFKTLQDANWDITAARVAPHINGVNHAARIAQLADADPALVRETLRHLLYYQVIMMVSDTSLRASQLQKPSTRAPS